MVVANPHIVWFFPNDRASCGLETWPTLKPTTKYGQLPIMSIDGGEPIAQSEATGEPCLVALGINTLLQITHRMPVFPPLLFPPLELKLADSG